MPTTTPSPEIPDLWLPARRSLATAKNIARKLALKLQRRQKFPAKGSFRRHALNSVVTTVDATEVASNAYVSAEREFTGKPTDSAVSS